MRPLEYCKLLFIFKKMKILFNKIATQVSKKKQPSPTIFDHHHQTQLFPPRKDRCILSYCSNSKVVVYFKSKLNSLLIRCTNESVHNWLVEIFKLIMAVFAYFQINCYCKTGTDKQGWKRNRPPCFSVCI